MVSPAAAARRNGGGVLESLYKVVMRRTPVYVTFVIVGAFLGERVSPFFHFVFTLDLKTCSFSPPKHFCVFMKNPEKIASVFDNWLKFM